MSAVPKFNSQPLFWPEWSRLAHSDARHDFVALRTSRRRDRVPAQ